MPEAWNSSGNVAAWSAHVPRGRALGRVAAAMVAVFLTACGDDAGASCGEGTVRQGDQCVAASLESDRGRNLGGQSDAGEEADAAGADGGADTGGDAAPLEPDAAPDLVADGSAEQPDVEVVDSPAADAPPRDNSSCIAENVGLEAVGFWDGTWDGHVEGSHPLAGGDFYQLANGTVSFEIFCENSKLVIEGRMEGLANGAFPFGGDLVGEYNPETQLIRMDLQNASVNMMVLEVQFVAVLDGQLVGNTFENGVWSGESTNPTGATGEGTWTATKRP